MNIQQIEWLICIIAVICLMVAAAVGFVQELS